jgi:aryl-alcohol dehydrogenase-like predicted oxidoreductase
VRLGLGTAQFGLDYGVSNARGKTAPQEVARILSYARSEGIDLLDTAALYGDSEAAIGAALVPDPSFRIVTKTPVSRAPRIGDAEALELRQTFARSLARLGRPQVYGLLVHAAGDLLKPGGERLWQAMAELKDAGLVAKIGYSVYSGADLEALLGRFQPDLVQVPVNALDQRLVRNGYLAQLKRMGVEVHARSIFLQGLLLLEPQAVPPHMRGSGDELDGYAAFLRQHGLSRLEGALQFIRTVDGVDVALIGVNDEPQLRDCVAAFRGSASAQIDFSVLSCSRDSLLDPSTWPDNSRAKDIAACQR